jgi:succinyl-CoA synthetase alpha subunit
MSILIDKNTKLVVQGITGSNGLFHARLCSEYGTKVVAGTNPGKGGMQVEAAGGRIPVLNTVKEAVGEFGADTSLIFVPAPFAADAVMEAADAGIKLVICITEGIPALDEIKIKMYLDDRGVRLIGPNCPGVITPGQCKAGIMPAHIHKPGRIGVVSRSGTLTYEAVGQLTHLDIGQSTCVGIGGDPVPGSTFVDILSLFNADAGTDGVIMIGEIGGSAEEAAAEYIGREMKKPVVAYIAGVTAPKGKRMGHAGAIISGNSGAAQEKMNALASAGVIVVDSPSEMGSAMAKRLQKMAG